MNELYLTDAYGTKWMFYISNTNCLCYTREGIKDEILMRNITNEFDIVTDSSGHFHIVCESTDGTLIYIRYNYSEWKKYEILKNKSAMPKISGIKLFMAENTPTAFYVLEHNGQKLMAEHKIREGLSTAPMIIDILDRSGIFFALFDAEKCFHLFYKNELGKPTYKRAAYAAKTFSGEDFPIEHDIVRICAAEDRGSVIHIAYIANINSYYTLCYYNTQSKAVKSLAFGIGAKTTPAIFESDGKIRIQWYDNSRAYECISSNGGETFSKPHNALRGAKVFRMFSGNSTKICISDTADIKANRDIRAVPLRDISKSSSQRELQSKLQKTESELKRMMEMYDDLSLKLDRLSSKLKASVKSKDDTSKKLPEKYSYSEIKSHLESSDEDMTDFFDRLDFDNINFDDAFSISSGKPDTSPDALSTADFTKNDTKSEKGAPNK